MSRSQLAYASVLTALFASSASLAQAEGPSPAESGTILLSVDRVFGLTSSTVTEKDSGGGATAEVTQSTAEFSLLGRSPMSAGGLLFSTPRLSLDFVVGPGITLGGGIGYTVVSQEAESKVTVNGSTATETDDGPSATGFLFAPRVGYLAVFGPYIGLWPKLGITYISVNSESSSGDTETSTGITGFSTDIPLVIMPGPGVMLTVGLTLDTTLAVSRETTSNSVTVEDESDRSVTEVGIQGGLAGFF